MWGACYTTEVYGHGVRAGKRLTFYVFGFCCKLVTVR